MALTDKLVAIGDAIREKTNTTEKLTLAQMPEMISSITGGEKEAGPMITFYDWDGTILHQYPRKDFESMNALPVPPNELEGHTCDGWNYSLETIKSMTGSVNVCTMYRQNDEPEEESEPVEPSYVDGTKLHLDISADMEVTLYYRQSITNGVTVNWGDGESSASERFGNTEITATHSYKKGEYIVTFDILDGCTLTFGGSTCVLETTSASNYFRLMTLKKVEINLRNTVIGAYAFRYCYGLEEAVIGDGTSQALPSQAFYYCCSLRHIQLSQSVTSIGGACFYRCYSIKEIIIPETITSIGSQAFMDCHSLKRIEIPKSVAEINSQAFYECYALKEVVLKNGIKRLYSSAFSLCYSLRKIKIPNSVITIGSSCFSNCRALENAVLPGNPDTSYDSSVFSGCYALRKIVIPDTLETIPNSIFNSCNLEFVGIPKSVKTISSGAFNSNYALRNVSISENTESISGFQSCYAIEKIIIPPSVTAFATSFTECKCIKEISLPDSIDFGSGILYNCFFDSSFFRKKTLNSIESKEEINSYAFAGNQFLEDIEIKGDIGISGFYNDYLLSKADIFEGVETIGGNAFQNDFALKSVAFPSTLKRIQNSAFYNCRNLQELTIPECAVGSQAFSLCYGLKKVKFTGDVSLGSAFSTCYSLENIEFADGVTVKITGGAFSTTLIESVSGFPRDTIFNNLSSTFASCYALSEADLSKFNSPNNTAYSTFDSCFSLEKAILPEGNITNTDRTFSSCRALREINIPESVTNIGYYTFYECFNLRKIKLAEYGVLTIGDRAFMNCYNLKEIKIPRSVTSLYYNAFNGCYNLFDIFMYPLNPPSIQGSSYLLIGSLPPYYKIHVPKGHIGEYREKWNGYDYGDHMVEFEYIQTRSTTVKKIIAFSATDLTAKNMFVHSDFDEGQTFTVSCTYTGQNLENITGTYDWKTDTVTLSFSKTNNVIYDKWEDIGVLVSADGKEDLDASFTLQAKCIDRDITFEYTVTNISTIYGFELTDDEYYQSNNQGKDNSYCLCRVDFETTSEKMCIDCIGGGEANYDFGILSKLDTVLSNNNSEDGSNAVQKSFRGSASYNQAVEYDIPLDAEAHFIYIKYRKDGSSSVGMDGLKFKIRFFEE